MNQKGMFAIIAALSIALLGAATTTSMNLVQESFAATKNCGDIGEKCWCYTQQSGTACFPNKGECNKAQRDDRSAQTGCFKKNL